MSEPTTIWTKQCEVYTTTLAAIKAAGGERKVVLPGSTVRVCDVQWETRSQRDGTMALVKVLPRVASRQFIIRPE